jgi:hypothetical protein
MGMFVGVEISDTAEDTHNTFGSYGFEFFSTTSMIRLRSATMTRPVTCARFGPWTLILRRIRSPYLLMSVRKTIRFTNANATSDVPLEATGSEADTIVNNDYVGSASTTGQAEEWLLDSGATCGVTYDKSHMTDLKPSDRKITIGNGDKIETLGQGPVLTDEHGQMVKLTDVYYAPSFTKHIVSMRKRIDDDWSFCIADKT